MKYNLFNIGGNIVKKDDSCLIKENKVENLIIHSVVLYHNKNTKKFCFQDQDAIYLFLDGKGLFELGNDIVYHVHSNELVYVNKNTPHRVVNIGDIHLRYIVLKERDKQ